MVRRTAAILMGLALGWMAQGWLMSAHAEDHGHNTHAKAQAKEEGAAEGEHHDGATQRLVVGTGQADFYCNVLLVAAGLFAAAVVLGAPAEKLRGPLPPDPADKHGHDDHAHDTHAPGVTSGGGHH